MMSDSSNPAASTAVGLADGEHAPVVSGMPMLDLLNGFIRELREAGLPEETINQLTCENPFRAFAR